MAEFHRTRLKQEQLAEHNIAEDVYGALTYLAPNDWHLQRIHEDFPKLVFAKTREQHV